MSFQLKNEGVAHQQDNPLDMEAWLSPPPNSEFGKFVLSDIFVGDWKFIGNANDNGQWPHFISSFWENKDNLVINTKTGHCTNFCYLCMKYVDWCMLKCSPWFSLFKLINISPPQIGGLKWASLSIPWKLHTKLQRRQAQQIQICLVTEILKYWSHISKSKMTLYLQSRRILTGQLF